MKRIKQILINLFDILLAIVIFYLILIIGVSVKWSYVITQLRNFVQS